MSQLEINRSIAKALADSFEKDFGKLNVLGELGSPPILDGSMTIAEMIAESVSAIIYYLINCITDVLELNIAKALRATEALNALHSKLQEDQA